MRNDVPQMRGRGAERPDPPVAPQYCVKCESPNTRTVFRVMTVADTGDEIRIAVVQCYACAHVRVIDA